MKSVSAFISKVPSIMPAHIHLSCAGSIHTVYDLLLEYNLHIVSEKSISVDHCLVAKRGATLESINRVMSHPQALAQCDNYLRKLKVIKEAVDDTAGAIFANTVMEPSCVHASCSGR